MAKTVEGSFGVQVKAEPWREGKLVVGILKSVDTLPNCESRKITFEWDKGQYAAVWETGVFAKKLDQMKVGNFYRVECLGKVLETQNGNAWDFSVLEADRSEEVAEWTDEYRKYVAGGGK